MTSMSEINLVGRVVEILNEMDSWCGETHIQKTAYVAKVIERVPFESKFILYKHGPYSFDMNVVLNHMRSQNILVVTPQGTYGSSYRLNEGLWAALGRAAGRRFDAYDQQLRFVCTQFARRKVAELERIATAIYVRLNFGLLNPQQQIAKLSELKPHIGVSEAQLAFSEAEVFFIQKR
jgi:hypothetical protein